MKLNKPKHLEKGQKIALIAPSSRVFPEKLQHSINNINKLGFEPIVKYATEDETGYLSANDQIRATNTEFFFNKKNNIGAIFCIRGGFGATRILKKINYARVRSNPKIFIGYSDITSLQSAFFVKCSMPSLHGIVASSVFSNYTIKQFYDLVVNPIENYQLPIRTHKILNSGTAQGRIVGGNLSILCSLIGTGYLFPFKNNIVFIEDIDEPPYKIDRMLTHLLQATDLKFASAIVFGIFNKCEPENHKIDPQFSYTIDQIIEQHFYNLKMPVIYNVNFGHIDESLIFPIGVKAFLDTNNFSITLLENLVK